MLRSTKKKQHRTRAFAKVGWTLKPHQHLSISFTCLRTLVFQISTFAICLNVIGKRADVLRLKFRIEKSIKNFPSLFACSAAIRFLITIVHILVLLFVQSLQAEHSFLSYILHHFLNLF